MRKTFLLCLLLLALTLAAAAALAEPPGHPSPGAGCFRAAHRRPARLRLSRTR